MLAIIVFVGFLLFIFSSTDDDSATGGVKYGPSKYIPRPTIPKLPSLQDLHFPTRPLAHKPNEQPDSTNGESSWLSHWAWLNPFSSSISLDENRAVLPPLEPRTPIYTFYEPSNKQDEQEKSADAQLLLSWRRAWYAQGFRPVILSRAEAMNNQFYEAVQRLKMDPNLETDFFKWLAWGNMGDGLFADWRCFPMGRYDDDLLVFLRRGATPTHITRFEKLEGGLFAAEKSRINDAIKEAIKAVHDRATTVMELVPAEFFKVEQPTAVAYYHSSMITTHYPKLNEKHVSTTAAGRLALTELINAHLHNTFLNSFSSGIAVLKPFPQHTTALVEPALRIAKAITQCPFSVDPTSCPPNKAKTCSPCSSSSKPISIIQPQTYKNTTNLFTVGAVPHPYTLISLQHGSDNVTTRYVRRETPRDPWIVEVTKDLLGPDRGGPSRVVLFKDLVAGSGGVGRSYWMTVEHFPGRQGEHLPDEVLEELEWHLGFAIPRVTDPKPIAPEEHKESSTAEKKPYERPMDDKARESKQQSKQQNKAAEGSESEQRKKDYAKAQKETAEKEYRLIDQAREVLQSKENNRIGIREVSEAWNLADTEVWHFTRAYR